MSDAAAIRPHLGLILDSLNHAKRAFSETVYPTYEMRLERLADVDAAIAAVRAIRKGTT